ncbi:aminotransferase class I/II-fold pyridoxal phosphate-dependent enzyme [Streptomyces sp. NPDC050703]|uniref:aminotransferase class I/II-fold pyridoxal phosphate-dependent enzyme n=1 Tax=Streptomyces sp. NPDC050703 TaxID=3157218 RepID=UPI00343FD195
MGLQAGPAEAAAVIHADYTRWWAVCRRLSSAAREQRAIPEAVVEYLDLFREEPREMIGAALETIDHGLALGEDVQRASHLRRTLLMKHGLDHTPSPPGRSSAAEADVLALVESRVRSRSLGGGRTPALWTRAIDAVDGMTLQYPDEPPQTAMTSYDYLGLLGHPAIDEAARAAIEKYGTGGHGTAAAAASLTSHRRLEERLAAFTGHQGAILLPSGFQTNATAIPALVGKGDWIFSDDLNHASIVAGCSIASARGAHVRTFRHNDPAHVRSLLSEAPDDVVKLVVCDAVFSADGDLLDLPAFDEACREHRAVLYLDEAHSLGVLGATGQGLHEHFGVARSPLGLTMATLSKTVPSAGGFLAGPASLTRLLRLAAPGHVFSAALPAMACGAAIAALDVIDQALSTFAAAFREE